MQYTKNIRSYKSDCSVSNDHKNKNKCVKIKKKKLMKKIRELDIKQLKK